MEPQKPNSLYLPEFLDSWPYDRRINPHHDEVSEAAHTWISSYGLLTPKLQRIFELFKSGLLAGLAYPEASKPHLRIVCDALNLIFLFDDYSDTQDPHIVSEVADMMMDAFCNPHASPNPHLEDRGRFGEMTRSFWTRSLQTLSPSSAHRFTVAFSKYSESIVQQAHDRSQNHIRDMESYVFLRRETIGAKLAFALLDCDDNVFNDHRVMELETAAVDLISLTNDAYSYKLEQSRGDDMHNMLTCIMHSEKLSLQDSMARLQTHISALKRRFLAIREQAVREQADSEQADLSLLKYIDGLGNWIRANDTWSFESQRYFGSRGLEIKARRTIDL